MASTCHELNYLDKKQRDPSPWWTPRLAGPVIAAAVVRLTLLAVALARNGTGVVVSSDTASYLAPGRNLLLHGRFVADGVPDLLRTPGYPVFLSITSFAGLPFAAIAQVIVSVFSVILIWRLAKACSNDGRIALSAAWIFAFEPIGVMYSVVLVSETLFLALFLMSMERVAAFLRGRRLRMLAEAGLWLAAATFVRPVTYFLPIALALGLFAVLARIPGLRWKAPVVMLVSVLPWVAAWQVRNWVETGYGGFSSITEINLLFYNAAGVTAAVEHRNVHDVRVGFGGTGFVNNSGQDYLYQPYLSLHPEQRGWTQGQRLAFMHSEALSVIRAHPGVYFRACLLTFAKTIFDPDVRFLDSLVNPGEPRHILDDLTDRGPVRGAILFAKAYPWAAAEKLSFALVMLGLYLLAGRGILLGHLDRSCRWLLLGVSFYFLAISGVAGGTGTDARYRLPVMPAVCTLAAAGIGKKTVAQENCPETAL